MKFKAKKNKKEILKKINIDNNPEYESQQKIKLDDEKTIELLIKQHIKNIKVKDMLRL